MIFSWRFSAIMTACVCARVCVWMCSRFAENVFGFGSQDQQKKKEEARVHVLRVLAEPNAECRSEKKKRKRNDSK